MAWKGSWRAKTAIPVAFGKWDGSHSRLARCPISEIGHDRTFRKRGIAWADELLTWSPWHIRKAEVFSRTRGGHQALQFAISWKKWLLKVPVKVPFSALLASRPTLGETTAIAQPHSLLKSPHLPLPSTAGRPRQVEGMPSWRPDRGSPLGSTRWARCNQTKWTSRCDARRTRHSGIPV